MLLRKPISNVSEIDLRTLITSGVGDARAVEFKRELPKPTTAGKLDFLGDVASFANAQGGHILYGASGRKGSLVEFNGLPVDEATEAVRWLEAIATTEIAPAIPGLRFQVVGLHNQNVALLVRVPQTWAGPHMVLFQQANKFYSRNAGGRYLLEVDELRAAFAVGESLREKIRQFRLDRVNAIMNRLLTVQLGEGPKTILHVLPAVSFQPGHRIDMDHVLADKPDLPQPMQARSLMSHYNFDGFISFSSMEKYAYSYVQVMRNGCLEATDSLLLEPRDGRKYFPSVSYERELIQCGDRLLGLLRRLEVDPPYVVMLSILGVRGYGMFVGSMRWESNAHQVERDNLFLDEVVIEDLAQEFSQAVRPIFDQVWNSCGWPRSLNYNAAGQWQEHSR